MKQEVSIMKKIKNKNLFTLLEVLVSMGVFSLLMLALMQFFSAAQGVWEKSGSKSELYDSARIAAQLLTEDLTTSFYGDEGHNMTQYKFYQNNSTRLTFAAQRGGDKGLTEVDYNWNTTDLSLEIRELSETDSSAPIGSTGWITYPSTDWITNIRGKTAQPIAENVLYANFEDKRAPGDANRPPRIVIATFAILSSAGYEKLDTIIRPTIASGSEDAKTLQVKNQIKTYFDAMAPVSSSGVRDKFSDSAVPESDSDKPAKEIIFDNVQFFKLLIPIER